MTELIPLMIERMGLIVVTAFIATRLKSFRRIVRRENIGRSRWLLVLMFGLFGIVSTYTGVEVSTSRVVHGDWISRIEPDNAIANTRNLSVVVGGILGGPAVGFGIGLIAGGHRYLLGGFTGFACALSTAAGGLIAGIAGRRNRHIGEVRPLFAASISLLVETLQMALILLFARPFSDAVQLVRLIGLPMIGVNAVGVWIFMLILKSVLQEEERTKALQTHKAFSIAEQTLPYFRKGLKPESCEQVAEIIYRMIGADAVSITDRDRVLAHIGAGGVHHLPKNGSLSDLTRRTLENGRILVARSSEEIGCRHAACPLRAAIALPLTVRSQTVGTLKLGFTDPKRLGSVETELAEGLAKLFSVQLELAAAENEMRLLKDAEIKALQAQVHPHFLFNAIQTIAAVTRQDAERARHLLIQLGVFFRNNLQGTRETLVPLTQEIGHVEAFLAIEEARFPGKFRFECELTPGAEKALVPPFTLQPLVENAVKHGLRHVRSGGVIRLEATRRSGRLVLLVHDNGTGMSPETLSRLGKTAVWSAHGTGTALETIRARLIGLFGDQSDFAVTSRENEGTTVCIQIPWIQTEKEESISEMESVYRRR